MFKKADKALRQFIDTLPHSCFIHDENHRIVYANEFYLKEVNLTLNEIIGRKYYELFPIHNGPLLSCTKAIKEKHTNNEKIRLPDKRVFYNYYIPYFKNYNKSKHSLHMMVNISEEEANLKELKDSRIQLNKKRSIEALLLYITELLYDDNYSDKITLENIINNIEKYNKYSDRHYILEYHNNQMNNTYTWNDKAIKPLKNEWKKIDKEKFPWINKKIEQKEVIHLPDIKLAPDSAKNEKKYWLKEGIKSILILPIYSKYTLFGFMVFDSVIEQTSWSAEDIASLKVIDYV